MIWRIATAFVLLAGVVQGAAKEHVAGRFDVVATVQPDGSLDVVEEIAFRFTGGTYTEVTRELRATETDGVEVIDASMDGVVLPQGKEAGQVEIDPGRSRARVAWHFAPTVDRTHVFRLRYRYKGVVRHGESDDWFQWPPFPSRFDYPIESGNVRLTWPEGVLLRQLSVEGPGTPSPTVGNSVTVRATNYRQRDNDVRIIVRFQPGSFIGAEPEWERAAQRADKMAPAFIAGGAMIIAAAGLALWLFFLRYRRDSADGTVSGAVTAPPDQLSPAIGGAISSGRVVAGTPQMLAVVFDLARRGVLRIEQQQGGGLFSRHVFTLRREPGSGLRPHEATVLEGLFKQGSSEARFESALRRLATRTSKVKRAIEDELKAEGYIDADRKEGASWLGISGLVVIALSIVFAIVLAAMEMPFGGAALFVPGALMLAGLAMLISAAALSTLSTTGMRVSRQWAGYQRHLKTEFRQNRVPIEGEAIGRLLPYAAALGLLRPFGKALEKTEVRNLPAWLRTLDAAGAKAAMLAVIVSSSRVAATHGGGVSGGGGVGAGGSSGAR